MASTAELSILIKVKDEATKTLGGIGGSLGKIGAIAGGVALAGIGALAAGITKMTLDAAALEPTKITFNNLTKSIGSTADSMLAKLRPATMGVVSDAGLMQAANKMMAMGLADTEDKAAGFSEMAVKLGTAMGKDATTAMEEFSLMLANHSIPRLDTFGMSAARVRARIAELTGDTEDVTDAQSELTDNITKAETNITKWSDQLMIAKLRQTEFTETTKESTRVQAQMKIDELTASLAKEAKELGDLKGITIDTTQAVAGMGREQAFLQAVQEQGAIAMGKVGDVSQTSAIAMQQVHATFKNVTDQVGAAFIPILAKLLVPLGELATKYGPQVTEWAEKLAGWIEEKLVPAFGTLIDFGGKLVGFIKDNWTAILAGLATILVTVVIPAFVAWAAAAVAAAAATIAAIAPVAVPVLAVMGVVALLKKAWDSDFGGIQEKTRAVVDAVKGFFEGLIEKIKAGIEFFTDIFAEFRQMGQNIVDGIKAGLMDAWGKLKTVFEFLINLLPEWAKKILGIASESKVFKAISNSIMDGLKSPIVARGPEIIGALKGLGANMVAVAQGVATKAMSTLQVTGAIPTSGGGGGGASSSGFATNLNQFAVPTSEEEQGLIDQFLAGTLSLEDYKPLAAAAKERARRAHLGFEFGGIVPGPIGRAQLAMVHGGETITPYSKGFTPPGQGAQQRGGDIVINLDGREIARVISPYMATELNQRGIRALG